VSNKKQELFTFRGQRCSVIYLLFNLLFWCLFLLFILSLPTVDVGDTKQSRLESTTEIMQNKHVKVLYYFVDDIKW
jgi:hypothetical protein